MKYLLYAMLCLLPVSVFAAGVDTVTIASSAMKKSPKCVVITPEGYKKNKLRYPVVYLLHGYGGNQADWISKVPRLKTLADQDSVIIVCPDGSIGSWYFDSPVDSSMRYETYVSKEIPVYVDEHYRTIADRAHRAITGLSMGGHGALYLGIRHKDFFGAAGSMSGGVDIRPFPKNWDIAKRLGDISTNAANWDANTVINVADALKDGDLKLLIDCGVKDFFIDVNRALHAKLLKNGIGHDYTERPGEHNWNYWDNAVVYQVTFFKKFFAEK